MKKLVFIFLLFAPLLFACAQKQKQPEQNLPEKGTAILITGAAARIPQEAALLEELYRKGELNHVEFIAGASSGALNAVMLNGILTKKITWKQYIRWLSEITNDSIYTNPDKKLPLDTSPLRNYLTHVINDSLGYHKMKDLPIPTAISIRQLSKIKLPKESYRLSNRKINQESDPELDIIDVLMASTAIPVVFPARQIQHAPEFTDQYFIDGGIGADHVPFAGLIDFMNKESKSFKKVIIISRKSDLEPDLNEELEKIGLKDRKIFDTMGISLDELLQKGFLKGLQAYEQQLPGLVDRTFVYVPDFERTFLLLDFDSLKEQYLITSKWAQNNDPVPLETYLAKFNNEN